MHRRTTHADRPPHPMNVPTRLVAFAVLLAVVLGASALAGRAIDPTDDAPRGGPHPAATQDADRPAGHPVGAPGDHPEEAPR